MSMRPACGRGASLRKLRRPAISGKRNRSIKIILSASRVVTPATSLVRTGSCRGETLRDVECRGLRGLDMTYGILGRPDRVRDTFPSWVQSGVNGTPEGEMHLVWASPGTAAAYRLDNRLLTARCW